MHYLDEYISEQNERNKLAGLVKEYEIRKPYNTVYDIPNELLNNILELFSKGAWQEGVEQAKNLCFQVKQMSNREANNFVKSLIRIAQDQKTQTGLS